MSIPKKFYVSRCYRSAEEILGFMVVADAEHTKAFQKKKETADRWGDNRLPKIYVDNEPKTGFQIVTNVSRYSTSNVVWRCLHPDGFEFEITSDNFMDLIQTSTIIEGAIQEELFFTENRKLVSTKTKLFAKEIERQEEKATQEALLSDIKEGDLFEIVGDFKKYHSDVYQYCGKYHVLVMNKNKPLCVADKSTKKEVVKNTNTGRYFIRNKISDYPIKKCGHIDINREDVVEALNTTLRTPCVSNTSQNDVLHDYYHLFVAGNDKPFKRSDCTVDYVDIDPRSLRGEYHNEYFMYYEYRGQIMRIFGAYRSNAGYYSNHKAPSDNWTGADGIFSYKAVLEENGQLNIPDVDFKDHQGFSGWRNTTPFTGFEYSSTSYNKKLHFDKMPETIKLGTIKIGK